MENRPGEETTVPIRNVFGEDDDDFLKNLTLAQIHYPEIASNIREFKRLGKKSASLSNEIEELEHEKEKVDSRLTNHAETIRERIYNV